MSMTLFGFLILGLLVYITIKGGKKFSKNPKKYLIILGSVLVTLAFLISMLFVDYESEIVNLFHSKRVPKEFRSYHYLNDTVTPDYSIKRLDGNTIRGILSDSLTSNLIIVTGNEYGEGFNELYHRIDSAGRLIESFSCPDGVYQTGRYLVGSESYCNWIINGDTTLRAHIPIEGKLNRDQFRSWYNKADFVKYFSKTNCVLHIDSLWYSCEIDFVLSDYDDDEELKSKQPQAEIYFTNRLAPVSFSESDYEEYAPPIPFISFTKFPSTAGNDILTFEYFSKEEYYSGFSDLFSGIGNPTGGNNRGARWEGSGYFKLRIGNKYIPFASYMKYYTEYETELSVYMGTNCAILATKYEIFLINIGNC